MKAEKKPWWRWIWTAKPKKGAVPEPEFSDHALRRRLLRLCLGRTRQKRPGEERPDA